MAIPCRPTATEQRPEGAAFFDYMAMFASLTPSARVQQDGEPQDMARPSSAASAGVPPHPIRTLTLHYLSEVACPLHAITLLKHLQKLELVDFFPRCEGTGVSRACALKHPAVICCYGKLGAQQACCNPCSRI